MRRLQQRVLALVSTLSLGSRLLSTAGLALLTAGFVAQTYGFYLRTLIAGRAPVANMYETIVFASWGAVLLALAYEARLGTRLFGACASGLSVVFLLVADGETNRELISLVLSEAGAPVVCAENGKLGVEAARREQFDLILMDMQMPGLDGPATVRRLRAMRAPVAIVALTANAMESDRMRCFDAGFDDFIAKPINPPLLFEKCLKWAQHTRAFSDALSCSTSTRAAWSPSTIVAAATTRTSGSRAGAKRARIAALLIAARLRSGGRAVRVARGGRSPARGGGRRRRG